MLGDFDRVGDWGEVLSCWRNVRGDVGDVASDERKVWAAGERAGFERRLGCSTFKPGSRAGSSGKTR